MAFALEMALRGNLARLFEADERAMMQATATVVRRAGTNAKNACRREIRRAGLGKLEFALRADSDPPRGPATDITVTLYSKAIVKRHGKIYDLFEVFQTGAVIRAREGAFLAIPTEKIGRVGKRRGQPGDFPDQLEPRIRRGADRGVLVFKNGGGVAFILLKTVTLRKQLPDLKAIAAKFGARIPDQIVKEWHRLAARAGLKFAA